MSRALQFLLTFIVVLTLNFMLPRMIPGDPLADLDDPQGLPIPLSQAQREQLMAYYGLDRPIMEQYGRYLSGLIRGDLGWSITYNAPVLHVLLARLRWTLLLVGLATLVYVVIGILLGAVSALYRGRTLDAFLLLTTSILGSFPAFFLAMLLIVLFVVRLGILPLGGAQSPLTLAADPLTRALSIARHMILPVLTLVPVNVGDIYYLTRNSVIRTLDNTYITVARAKGLAEGRLLLRYMLPNALLPIITLVALRFGFLVMGAVMVEVAFAYPGIGLVIVEASRGRDYPMLQGAFVLIMFSVIGANLLGDLLHGVLDPRVRGRE
ncbi:MAG TPA: ABC transporter permease [Chloroflexi bacterium]|jgi:peptide/nickel transport system permease protein|nr:ABC transporter permease [Chloroflexota bacterium]